MSVICFLTSATDAQLEYLFAHSEQIDNFLHSRPAQKRSWFWKLFWSQTAVPPEISDISSRRQLDLRKAWEAIHFVLTGTTSEDASLPAGTVLAAGEYIGEEDVGYGPARGVSAREIAAFAEFLEPITTEVFSARVDAAAMAKLEVYGAPPPNDDRAIRFFTHEYADFRKFISTLAAAGLGLVVQFV